jgi:hypothetical protein
VIPPATISVSGRLQIDGQLPQGINLQALGLALIDSSERGNGATRFVRMRQADSDGTFQINNVSSGE